MTIKDLKVGEKAVIEHIDCKPDTKRRLLDIGLTRGSEIYVKRFAPLGDPVEIAIRDFSLAIRLSDAKTITVKKCAEGGIKK